MAKSARASVKKSNRSRLRKSVFGPIEKARTERLSAKLQELAAQPKPETFDMQIEPKRQQDATASTDTTSNDEQAGNNAEDMDVDGASTTTKTRRSKSGRGNGKDDGGKVRKRRARKVANRLTFPMMKERRTVSKQVKKR